MQDMEDYDHPDGTPFMGKRYNNVRCPSNYQIVYAGKMAVIGDSGRRYFFEDSSHTATYGSYCHDGRPHSLLRLEKIKNFGECECTTKHVHEGEVRRVVIVFPETQPIYAEFCKSAVEKIRGNGFVVEPLYDPDEVTRLRAALEGYDQIVRVVISALKRDADDGKTLRGEMAKQLEDALNVACEAAEGK